MSEVVHAVVIFYGIVGYIGCLCLLACLLEKVRERWGRVPVIDAVWWKIHDGVEWLIRLPGRCLRWARPRDTPRGLGGP